MNSLARICWIMAPIYVLIGMLLGIHMSSSGDYTWAPAHAHLNLIGWVSIALFGTFYALQPHAAKWMISKLQVALANLTVILMFPGIILAIEGKTEVLAIVSSLLAVLMMAMFLFIVFKATGSKQPD